MLPIVYTSGMHGPYSQSALRDVDPSLPAHTHIHIAGKEKSWKKMQASLLYWHKVIQVIA